MELFSKPSSQLRGGGTLSIDKNYCVLRVRNLTQLAEVIQFFDKYPPLITQKSGLFTI